MVATVLFTIISGTVFSLLLSAQLQYQGESSVSAAFQQANVAIDQIVRDVHSGRLSAEEFVLWAAVSDAYPEKLRGAICLEPKLPITTLPRVKRELHNAR